MPLVFASSKNGKHRFPATDHGLAYSYHLTNGTYDTAIRLTGMTRHRAMADPLADDKDYISLTDMLKAKDGDFFISDWLRNRNTVESLGVWGRIHIGSNG